MYKRKIASRHGVTDVLRLLRLKVRGSSLFFVYERVPRTEKRVYKIFGLLYSVV